MACDRAWLEKLFKEGTGFKARDYQIEAVSKLVGGVSELDYALLQHAPRGPRGTTYITKVFGHAQPHHKAFGSGS